jgi:hypothetical protein
VFDQRYPAREMIALQKTGELPEHPVTWLFSEGSIESVKVEIRHEADKHENLDFDTYSNIPSDFST